MGKQDPWKPCRCHPTALGHYFDSEAMKCVNPRRLALASPRGQIYSSDAALAAPRRCNRKYSDHLANPQPCPYDYPWAQGRLWQAHWGRTAEDAKTYRYRPPGRHRRSKRYRRPGADLQA